MFFLLRAEIGSSRFTLPTSHRRPYRAICSYQPPPLPPFIPCTSYPALGRTSLSRTPPARRSQSMRRRVLGPVTGRRWMKATTHAASIPMAARSGSGCTRRALAFVPRHSAPSPRFQPRRCVRIKVSAWTTRRARVLGAALCSYWRARRAREAFLLEVRVRNRANARGRFARPRAAARVAAYVVG